MVGRVCMDQTMIDLSDVENSVVGDTVILFGDGCYGEPTAYDVAGWMRSITDEVVSAISRRVPRVYTEEGKAVKVVNYLHEKNSL